MRRFVHRQGKQQDQEGDEDLSEIDVQSGTRVPHGFVDRGWWMVDKSSYPPSTTHYPPARLPTRVSEIVDHRGRHLRSDDRLELFTCRTAHTREAAERREQRLAAARADTWDGVELGAQVAKGSGAAMERHGEPVRL